MHHAQIDLERMFGCLIAENEQKTKRVVYQVYATSYTVDSYDVRDGQMVRHTEHLKGEYNISNADCVLPVLVRWLAKGLHGLPSGAILTDF